MISSLKPDAQQFLNRLNRISARQDRAQRQISTGLRLSRVSDDPERISSLLQARANLAATDQRMANLGRIKAEVDAGEQALQSAVALYERARTLGAQGATGAASAQSRAALGQEIGSILEQLVGLAGTVVEGRYIFSGDSDQTPPYTIDLTLPTPLSVYQGAGVTRVAQHPNGTTFTVARTAEDVFDAAAPEDNVFLTLTTLREALLGNDEAAVQAAMNAMRRPGDRLNSQLAFYGTTQNKIAEANEFGENLRVQLRSQIGRMEDADLTEAILDLQQSQVQQEAALTARARLPRTTLFDYIG